MTPKEKALELVELYCQLLSIRSYENKNKAKDCALIAVDEILNFLNELFTEDYLANLLEKQYWEQVKTEIENL